MTLGRSARDDEEDTQPETNNAMVSATFLVKNTSAEPVPLTAVQPACGCTASSFSPENLSSNEETKVGLTFNTRGYAGLEFKKSAKVKTDSATNETTVCFAK